jgi:hypothetical protein
VYTGTYYENVNFDGRNITIKAANTSQTPVIDGGQNAPCVDFADGQNNDAHLKGFEITNGAGAEYEWQTDERLSTYTALVGAGIDATQASPTIEDCTFYGLDIWDGHFTPNEGAAIFTGLYGDLSEDDYFSKMQLLDCTFYDCKCLQGHVVTVSGADGDLLIEGCLFYDPDSSSGAVKINNWKTGVTVNACRFNGDESNHGLTIFGYTGDTTQTADITNNAFYDSSGCNLRLFHKGIFRVINNTFVDNTDCVSIYANPSYCKTINIKCYNNIFWDNTHYAYDREIWLMADWSNTDIILDAYDCNIENGTSAIYEDPLGEGTYTVSTGNLEDEEPVFDDQAGEDYHLDSTSGMIDEGDGSAPGLPTYDWEGDRRSYNGTPDIGADEYTG